MFDCVTERDAGKHRQQGMRAKARLGQRPKETVSLLEKLLLTPQALGCYTEGLSPRALLAMTCLHLFTLWLFLQGIAKQTNERAWGTTKQAS